MKTVSFTAMIDDTAKDYRLLVNLERAHNNQLPKRIVKALLSLETGLTGYKISRLQQALQAAARAKHDGADIEWIVAALLHDISDDLAPDNHGQFAASIIKPYVNRPVIWTVNMHGLF
jgi:predicted HD phosphohydrolase